jgi:peptide/nickel transport system substrate-binding protein
VKLRKLFAAPAIAGLVALSACGGGGGQDAGTEEENAIAPISSQDMNIQDRGTLQQGGQVRLDVVDFGNNWNPFHVDGNNDDLSRARNPILPTFFNYDAKGVPSPNTDWLVSATETSKSPTTVNYKLNPKAVWGDGSPVDGDDMAATWKACNAENKAFNCASTQGFDSIKSITTGADKFDVTVTYKGAYPDWTQPFSYPGVVRAESVKDANTFNKGWTELKNEWLSGPFKVQSFDKTQKVLTEVPNDKWWGDKPLLDKITFRTISADATAAAFVNNELDSFDIGPDPDAFKRVQGVADAQIRKAAGPNFRHFTFNTKAGLLTDKAIRQAIVRGLDRESIGASDLAGIDWPVRPLNNHILLENQEGYADSAKATGLDYDPEKAKADLEAAGWKAGADGIREKDGKKLEVKFSQLAGVAVSENEALQAQNQLKEIGIKVNIVTVPIAKFQDGSLLSGHEFEIVAFSWIGTQYPFTSIDQIYGTGKDSNYAQLSMPEVDALVKQINTETDIPKRIQLTNEADKIIWENVHTLPLYQRPELVAVKAKLANYGAKGLGNFQWEDIGYQK